MSCSKTFSITIDSPTPPFDCLGNSTTIGGASWTVVRTQSGGSGTVTFGGALGTFSVESAGDLIVEEWTATVTICNPTETQVDINYQVEADVVVLVDNAVCEIFVPGIQGPNSSAASLHLSPFGVLACPPLSNTSFTFTISAFTYGNVVAEASFSGTVVFTQ